LREKYPAILTLKIEGAGIEDSPYPSRITDSAPRHVLDALVDMLGDGIKLVPLTTPDTEDPPEDPTPS
jgi:hypothetical protein